MPNTTSTSAGLGSLACRSVVAIVNWPPVRVLSLTREPTGRGPGPHPPDRMIRRNPPRWLPAALQAGLDGADHDLQHQPDHHQVPQHLDHGHDAGRLGHGRDVPEPDGGEHRDGEVEGVGAVQGLAERLGLEVGHLEVDQGEQQQEQRDGGGKGLDRAQARVARPQDGPDLPGDDHGEHQQPDQQQRDRGGVHRAAHRHRVVEHHQHGRGQRRPQQGQRHPPPGRFHDPLGPPAWALRHRARPATGPVPAAAVSSGPPTRRRKT